MNGMAPYINRMLNEANRLLDAKEIGATEERRLDYLMELTESLDRHNAIIERWIKMRSGEFNLKIESFPVSQLFDILSKSTQAVTATEELQFVITVAEIAESTVLSTSREIRWALQQY